MLLVFDRDDGVPAIDRSLAVARRRRVPTYFVGLAALIVPGSNAMSTAALDRAANARFTGVPSRHWRRVSAWLGLATDAPRPTRPLGTGRWHLPKRPRVSVARYDAEKCRLADICARLRLLFGLESANVRLDRGSG